MLAMNDAACKQKHKAKRQHNSLNTIHQCLRVKCNQQKRTKIMQSNFNTNNNNQRAQIKLEKCKKHCRSSCSRSKLLITTCKQTTTTTTTTNTSIIINSSNSNASDSNAKQYECLYYSRLTRKQLLANNNNNVKCSSFKLKSRSKLSEYFNVVLFACLILLSETFQLLLAKSLQIGESSNINVDLNVNNNEQQAANIRIASIIVPTKLRENQDARLSCQYDIFNERLQSVKWYKDNNEFYRYTPSLDGGNNNNNNNIGTKLVFPLKPASFSVDFKRSNDSSVVLHNVRTEASGVYKCRVSIENSFKSISAERSMQVLARDSAARKQAASAWHHSTGQRPQRAQPTQAATAATSAAASNSAVAAHSSPLAFSAFATQQLYCCLLATICVLLLVSS